MHYKIWVVQDVYGIFGPTDYFVYYIYLWQWRTEIRLKKTDGRTKTDFRKRGHRRPTKKKRETRVEYDGFYRYTIAGPHIYILIYYINVLVTSSRIIIMDVISGRRSTDVRKND